MRFNRKKDIKDKIRQLQAIIHLQEEGKKLFAQTTKETVSKNKDLIGFMRGNVRQGMHELTLAMKYDHVTINRACREQKHIKIAMSEYSVQEARASLSNYVFDRMNMHNALLYEVRRRGKLLEDQQLRLQHLTDLETPSPKALIQLQIIRQLENNIEKVLMSITTAQKTYVLYLKMVDLLRDELAQLPLILDDLEHWVQVYQFELKGMHLMTADGVEAMETAKTDMINIETELIAEKKFRDNSLSIERKQIERIHMKEATERNRRMQARRDMMDFPMMSRDLNRGARLEASKAQLEYQGLVITEVDKIKCAVQCSHLWDIAGRFTAQKKSEENLLQQIAESEKKRKELKAQLKALELERAELKFHQKPSSISSWKLEEDLRNLLIEEEHRLQKVESQVSKNQELLLHFENGLDNLILRLCGITVPGQEEFRGEIGDMFDKLQFVETKLMHLLKMMQNLPTFDFSKEETNETFVYVRNFLEESTREEPQNLRIEFDLDEEDVREAFNFADIDHSYVPNRDEIKKQGFKLIEDKTKVTKKKQRGTSKK
ncbi:coiled-coil domain-containing protein 183 isoform X1 [Hemicordylus capensis]|uniref:coiled-coil domain-containing protein 183 isoform X1 n=2 Tax=Hemicordylus capensis TaxID=884348 RepID=UPI00230307DE|nr:coiled-coil domain-containing protein 183 isoform X1 [Hemicordylus capensis]